jgi:hypothetical protein
MRLLAICIVLVSQFTLPGLGQQAAPTRKPAEVVCTFDDGKDVRIEYYDSVAKRDEGFREGRPWEPGGSPMFLFTQTAVTLSGSVIPAGAYSLYIIPEKKDWSLVVNRNVTAGTKYDEKEDLARGQMQIGAIDTPAKQPQIVLGHLGAKQCSMRLYYQETGAWADFLER